MRRWFPIIGILVMFLVSGCAATLDNRVADLEVKMAKMEKQVKTGLASGSGANFYPARDFIGGTAGCLDAIASPSLGDVAFVMKRGDTAYGDITCLYMYHDFAAEVAEASPWFIKPDTGSSANYAWCLMTSSNMIPVSVTGNVLLTVAQVRSGYIEVSAAAIVSLPLAATVGYGTVVMIHVRDDNELCQINPDDADRIALGTGGADALAAGVAIKNTVAAATGGGDFVCMIAVTDADASTTDGWVVLGKQGTWVTT